MRQKIPFRLPPYLPRLGTWLLAILTFMGLTAFLWTTLPTQSTTTTLQQPTPIPAIEDTTRIKLEDILFYTSKGEMFFDTNKTKKLHGFTGDSIIHYYGYLFDMGEHNELRLSRKSQVYDTYYGNAQVYFYELYHKGYSTREIAGNFDYMNGTLAKGFVRPYNMEVDTTVKITGKQAIDIALKHLNAPKYVWEDTFWENRAKARGKTYYPTPKLVIKPLGKTHKLFYELNVFVEINKNYIIDIDPVNGKVINVRHDYDQCTCTHDQHTNHDLNIAFYPSPKSAMVQRCTDVTGAFNYKLKQDNSRKIELFQSIGGPPSNVCWSISTPANTPANTAYWATQYVYDYFKNEHSRLSYNGVNGKTNLLLISGGSAGSAIDPISDNLTITLKADLVNHQNSYTTLDAIGHEYSHGIDRKTTNLNSKPIFSESRIIMEGFCDILGVAIKSQFLGANSYTFLEEVLNSETRYLNNPANSTNSSGITDAQPKFYQGINWASGLGVLTDDGYYIHHNNGIMNYWFYLLSEGTSGFYTNEVGNTYHSTSMGMKKAVDILYEAYTVELGKSKYPNKDFNDLRKATLAVADQCSFDWERIRIAWDAVGVMGECDLSSDATVTPVSAEGNCDCRAVLKVCGSHDYEVKWYDVTGSEISDERGIIDGLCSGEYTYVVTDGDCEIEGRIDCRKRYIGEVPFETLLTPPSPIATPPTILAPQITTYCSTGDIDISVLGGVPPYTYAWSNGAISQDLTGVAGGTYYVTVTSSGVGDISVIGGPYTVTPSGPTVTSNLNVPCAGGGATAGSVSLNISNGTPPYSILWSNGSTGSTFFVVGEPSGGFPSQNASVTVTDANGCVFTDSYTIAPHEISLTGFASKACVAFNDGYASAWASTANPPVSYQWSTGATTSSITNLAPGGYSVVVTDAVGCVKAKNFTVAVEQPTLVPNTVGDICEVQEFCHGNATGPIQDVTQTGPQFVPDFAAPSNSICQITETCPYDATHQIPLALGMISNPIVAESFLFNPQLPEDFNCYEKIVCQIPGFPTEEASSFLGPATGGPCQIVDIGPDLFECCQVLCNGVHVNWACRKLAIAAPPPPINGGIFTVYPSPFQDYLTVEFESMDQEEAIISLYNNLGQQVHQEVQQTIIGLNTFTLNLVGKVNNGFYYVKVALPNQPTMTRKVIRQN